MDDCFCATFDVDPYIFKLKRNKYTKFVRGIYAVLWFWQLLKERFRSLMQCRTTLIVYLIWTQLLHYIYMIIPRSIRDIHDFQKIIQDTFVLSFKTIFLVKICLFIHQFSLNKSNNMRWFVRVQHNLNLCLCLFMVIKDQHIRYKKKKIVWFVLTELCCEESNRYT